MEMCSNILPYIQDSLLSLESIMLSFVFQDIAIINEDNLPMFNRCGVMALVAAYLNFLSQMIAVPAFCQHVSKVTHN